MCTSGALRSDSQVTASERSRTTRKLRRSTTPVSALRADRVEGFSPVISESTTWLRAVDDATAGELRRAGRALAGAAGALLLVGLAATAADVAAGLGGVRALAGGGLLGHHDLVDQRDVDR